MNDYDEDMGKIMNQDPQSNRISQAPDWLIRGLVKSATFADESPDEPMFGTGVTYSELKTQVQSLLVRSGLNLTKREVGVATHWLTQRIANSVSDKDTKETLTETTLGFVSQYIVDKAEQRATGVSNRSQIHTREWYDQNYGGVPGMGKDAALDVAEDSAPQVFVGIDGDNIGGLVEETLLTDDPEAAATISKSIHGAHREIGKVIRERGGRLIFDGGDNMLFTFPMDTEAIEGIRAIYKEKTGHSATVGVGRRPIEAHFALVVGKNTGKDKTVVYGQEVLSEYEAIREEQEEAAPLLQKLKYKAGGQEQVVDNAFWDLGVNRVLRAAMVKLGLPAGEEAVYEMFIRLVQRYDLGSVASIHRFFSMGFDAIEQGVREVRARRLSWAVRTAKDEAPERGVYEDQIDKFIAVALALGSKLSHLYSSDPENFGDVTASYMGTIDRVGRVIEGMDQKTKDKPMVGSGLFDLPTLVGEIMSMVIPVDQALTIAVRARDNAASAHMGKDSEVPIDPRPVIDAVTGLISKINDLAMSLESTLLVTASSCMAAVPTSAPQHFPGQQVPPGGRTQKSPHRRHDWLTIEDYNRDQTDWSKTDVNYVGGNVPKDSQIMVGGDPGDAIYVP